MQEILRENSSTEESCCRLCVFYSFIFPFIRPQRRAGNMALKPKEDRSACSPTLKIDPTFP